MVGERLLSGMTSVMSGKCCWHFGRLAANIKFIKRCGACGGGGGGVFGLHVELVLGELLEDPPSLEVLGVGGVYLLE